MLYTQQQREEQAELIAQNPDLTIAEVVEQLGHREPLNFSAHYVKRINQLVVGDVFKFSAMGPWHRIERIDDGRFILTYRAVKEFQIRYYSAGSCSLKSQQWVHVK